MSISTDCEYVCAMMGIEPRVWHILGKCSTIEANLKPPPPPF